MNVSVRSTGTVRSRQGPLVAWGMHHIVNPIMLRLLASPLHARIGSAEMMVLSFRGRRSGKPYQFPIGYLQDGSTLISYTPFSWWPNLRGGAPVTVTLRGRIHTGTADVCTDTSVVERGMHTYLRHNPGDAMFWSVKIDRDGQPVAADIVRAAPLNVQIRIALDDPGTLGLTRF